MAVLDRHGLHYGTDDDGRIGSFHAGHLFRIDCGDGVLRARSRWHRSVEGSRGAELHALLRRWNAEEVAVRLTATPWGPGLTVDALAEVLCPGGLTDGQIHRHITGVMNDALRAFGLLDQALTTER